LANATGIAGIGFIDVVLVGAGYIGWVDDQTVNAHLFEVSLDPKAELATFICAGVLRPRVVGDEKEC
jgi:hypothetical protein